MIRRKDKIKSLVLFHFIVCLCMCMYIHAFLLLSVHTNVSHCIFPYIAPHSSSHSYKQTEVDKGTKLSHQCHVNKVSTHQLDTRSS